MTEPVKTDAEKEAFKDGWNAAIDAILGELRVVPPSRIGEAAFARRITLMRDQPD